MGSELSHHIPIKGYEMQILRKFTKTNEDPFECVEWVRRDAIIESPTKGIIFKQENVEAPATWSDQAVNVVAQKYFRGIPGTEEREWSIRLMIKRVVDTTVGWGWEDGYYSDESTRETHRGELIYILLNQLASFNSPVWFNIGSENKPQASACFITGIEDSLDSIMNQATVEANIFHEGSGIGLNLSSLRGEGEPLSAGGTSSGAISFLEGLDAFAGVIKSGGKTRRAAAMRILDSDHPDIEKFINCKAEEQKRIRILVDGGISGEYNEDNPAQSSVRYQNANHSVRVTDQFMRAVENDEDWTLIPRTRIGKTRVVKARQLFNAIAAAAWECGDPGMQYDTTINKSHTCPKHGRINASNPCQPAFATVLTQDGVQILGNVEIGDLIWSGNGWTEITNKWSTGTKPVHKYKTTAGAFVGTKNHRIVQGGEKVEVGDAEAIDICKVIPQTIESLHDLDPTDVLDGLMFGDGYVKICNEGRQHYPILFVGEDDHDYFTDPLVGDLINETPFDKLQHRADATTLTREELLPTYVRTIPGTFFFGDSNKVRGFLRGLYSANGSIAEGRVTLKASCFRVVEQVQQMLSYLGVRSYYTTNRPSEIEFSNGVYACKESYDLNITSDRSIFRDMIGFIQTEKAKRLEAACDRPTRNWSKETFDIRDVEYLGDFEVFDITVADPAHTYWTGGMLVSNCSEFMFLDHSACNLASINLIHFFAKDHAKVTDFEHVVRVMLIAQDILVDRAYYPTDKIRDNSIKFRPLGLGYTNLGAMLMGMGLAYDSDEGREIAALITAAMHTHAMTVSHDMAANLGTFSGWDRNQADMDDIMRLHRRLANEISDPNGDSTVKRAIKASIKGSADELAEIFRMESTFKLRNAQLTLLAPTGTISFMMDCITTGIEPELMLKMVQKLAGGGEFVRDNSIIHQALNSLGYSNEEADLISIHIAQHGHVEGSLLKKKHYDVFDCSFKAPGSDRCISPEGHIKMMAAVQPHLSGAISKTVNLPNNVTKKKISDLYMMAWKSGLKSIALYRDGCKNQPKSSGITKKAKKTLKRRRLPQDRPSMTHKFEIGGHGGLITTGFYPDTGKLGEVLLLVGKQGSTYQTFMDTIGTLLSVMMQYDIPMGDITSKLIGQRCDPSGFTSNPEIPKAKSPIDYLGHLLNKKYAANGAPSPETNKMILSDMVPCPECSTLMRAGSCEPCSCCGFFGGC